MASIDIKDAVIQLYEDYSLTEGYDDEQAQLVHAWAEGQLQLSANTVNDEAEFEERYNDITRVLKMVNRFIVKRAEMDEVKQRRFMQLYIERAAQGGFPTKMDSAGEFYEVVQGLDDTATVRAFLGFTETGSPTVSADPAPPPRTAPFASLPNQPASDEIISDVNDKTPADKLRDSVQASLASMRERADKDQANIIQPATDDGVEPTEALPETTDNVETPADNQADDEEKDGKQSRWGLSNLFKRSNIDDE